MIQCTVFDTALYLFACVGGCKDCLMFDQALLCKHPSIRLSSAIQAEVRLSNVILQKRGLFIRTIKQKPNNSDTYEIL